MCELKDFLLKYNIPIKLNLTNNEYKNTVSILNGLHLDYIKNSDKTPNIYFIFSLYNYYILDYKTSLINFTYYIKKSFKLDNNNYYGNLDFIYCLAYITYEHTNILSDEIKSYFNLAIKLNHKKSHYYYASILKKEKFYKESLDLFLKFYNIYKDIYAAFQILLLYYDFLGNINFAFDYISIIQSKIEDILDTKDHNFVYEFYTKYISIGEDNDIIQFQKEALFNFIRYIKKNNTDYKNILNILYYKLCNIYKFQNNTNKYFYYLIKACMENNYNAMIDYALEIEDNDPKLALNYYNKAAKELDSHYADYLYLKVFYKLNNYILKDLSIFDLNTHLYKKEILKMLNK